jgi:hypothetical protein
MREHRKFTRKLVNLLESNENLFVDDGNKRQKFISDTDNIVHRRDGFDGLCALRTRQTLVV